ncbi:hypothetical protein AMS68_007013 [Peltaster fructicola]|uniref:Uncharacterized protein n=1 Tax=Peltaster fructicola TaxID=286661 RepID=A0A6H0Y3G9_9PEZI|nr:hypothetical protein AMS68_007013 [Peltaster fructicola]
MSYRDAGENYFQTSDSIASSERKQAKSRNKYGRPIKLSSKILASHVDPYDHRAVYVAEAAGVIRRVVLSTGERTQVTRATAPLTSIALSPKGNQLFTGCWDKNIYCTDFDTGKERRFTGHADFVKCLLTSSINGSTVLISGSADSTIIVWDLQTGQQRYKLKGHAGAIQDLQIDPLSWPTDRRDPLESFVVFSAGSDRVIRQWQIGLHAGFELPTSIDKPILAHETSVWKIYFDSSGDLWTASADKTAKHLVRNRGWEPDSIFTHPDYVKDLVVSETLGLAVTACRDEEVRVWDIASGKLLCTYTGHFEEVTSLLLLRSNVVSTSIDGTIRQWSLERNDMQRFAEELEQDRRDQPQAHSSVATTAEEDAELEALMEDD